MVSPDPHDHVDRLDRAANERGSGHPADRVRQLELVSRRRESRHGLRRVEETEETVQVRVLLCFEDRDESWGDASAGIAPSTPTWTSRWATAA